MKALITGGAGFIGSNLALELQSQSAEVVVADNYLSGNADNLAEFGGQVIEADTTEPWKFEGDFDLVFHHGDITDPRYEPNNEVYEKNLASFQNAVNFSREQNAKLIYASTAGLYGNGPTPMKEDQEKEILTEYGKSKLEMDRLASQYADKMPIVGLRYFNVFGPREAGKGRPASMVYHLYQQMKQGRQPRLFSHGEQKRDFIYVNDCVSANLCAIKAPSGVYNVGTGVATTFKELVSCLNEALELSLEIEYFPMPFDKKTYQSNTQADTEWAQETLEFESQYPLLDAVKHYIRWLSESETA